MLPHAAHGARDQRIAGLGWPALTMEAWNFCAAPSSTLTGFGMIESARSLAIMTAADADFVGSALLLAVTWTTAEAGKSDGAVYTPAAVMVPSALFPPGTPLMLQVTPVSAALATVAAKPCVFPRSTEGLVGVTLTLMARGGDAGGGAADPVPLATQPCVDAARARTKNRNGAEN